MQYELDVNEITGGCIGGDGKWTQKNTICLEKENNIFLFCNISVDFSINIARLIWSATFSDWLFCYQVLSIAISATILLNHTFHRQTLNLPNMDIPDQIPLNCQPALRTKTRVAHPNHLNPSYFTQDLRIRALHVKHDITLRLSDDRTRLSPSIEQFIQLHKANNKKLTQSKCCHNPCKRKTKTNRRVEKIEKVNSSKRNPSTRANQIELAKIFKPTNILFENSSRPMKIQYFENRPIDGNSEFAALVARFRLANQNHPMTEMSKNLKRLPRQCKTP